MANRYKEVFDPNHSQECICHRGPMNRGLEESPDGDFVDIEDYEKLQQQLAKANERIKELEEQQTEDLMFLLEQSLIIEHKQDYKKLKELREKYSVAF
tara:strand:- start:35873 stop:36166 length:294 start_codon:yes stop_codon:yes gene_type:complete